MQPIQIASNQIACPQCWPNWPYLAVVRIQEDEKEIGSMVDLFRTVDLPGYSSTVFLTNIFALPRAVEELLALPHETYDTSDEVVAAGWRADY